MKRPRHRPQRSYPDAERVILECELEACVHCGQPLVPSGTWHIRKYVQTMQGPLFLAESEADLLEQIRRVPLEEYRQNRRRLEEAEAPRRLLHRLHRNPLRTMRDLVKQHTVRRAALVSVTGSSP